MICRNCQKRLLSKAISGVAKIRTPMVLLSLEGLAVVCPKCNTPAPLDVTVGADLRKSLDGPQRATVLPLRRKQLDDKVKAP